MKILHVIGTVDRASGGPIEGILQEARHPGSIGVESEILASDPPDAPFLVDFPLKVHPMGPSPGPQARYNPFFRYHVTPRMIGWLRKNASLYDVVVIHGLFNFAPFSASLSILGGKVPYLVYTHGMMDPWFKAKHPFKHAMKQCMWFLFEGRLLKHASSVLFTSEDERLLARGTYLGHVGYPETVVRFGTASPPPRTESLAAAFKAAVPSVGDRRYLLFLSRIHPKKGCDLLVAAFAEFAKAFPDVDLVIAGPDQSRLKAGLVETSQRMGVASRIHWPGMLTGDAKWGAFYGAEAFVLPSHQENFGIVIAEALSCGTAVLTTNKVNIWREIAAGNAGFIENDDLSGIRALLTAWGKQAAADKVRISANAKNTFLQYFHIDAAVESFAEAVSKAISGRAR